jgi:hypothetical protein
MQLSIDKAVMRVCDVTFSQCDASWPCEYALCSVLLAPSGRFIITPAQVLTKGGWSMFVARPVHCRL